MPSTSRVKIHSLFSEEQLTRLDRFFHDAGGHPDLAGIARFLRSAFGVELTLDADIVAGFATDSSNLPGRADAVARPRSEFECAVVLSVCARAGIPVTVSGGKSNLTGSATPEGGVLLSSVNLRSPVAEIDHGSQTVRTSPGVILEELRQSVLEQTGGRLCFPVDPTSRAEASVGGAIACNCSGFTPGETGAIRSWLQGVRFLLPDGRLIEAERGRFISEDGLFDLAGTPWPVPGYERPTVKNAGGPFSAPDGVMDLMDLIVGSEGIFGVVSECTLKLAPQPGALLDLFFSLPTERDALRFAETVQTQYQNDLSGLTAFEYFGVNCRSYMKHKDRFFQGSDEVGIYIQQPLEGMDELEAAEGWLELLAEAELDLDEDAIILLDTPKLRELFMEARHSMPAHAIEVAQQRGSFTIMSDTVVPLEQFAEFLEFTHAHLKDNGLDYLTFGHLGDCHLHVTLVPHQEQIDTAVAAYDSLVAKSADLGGVYSGEHGTGKRKRKDFLRCYGEGAVQQVRDSRRAVDPDLLFNRGNVI